MAQRAWGKIRMAKFRFQDLEIWQKAIEIGDRLLDIADDLEAQKKFRFSEQLRGAALSISNNIAEGSGSDSDREFAQFLNYAKRSCFEDANMLVVFCRRNLITEETKKGLFEALDEECRKIQNFKKSLRA
jgi:four helix bundle protein